MSDFTDFLRSQKPLCLGLPFYKALLKDKLFYTLCERSESDFDGRNLFEQVCPKAKVCDTECLGRPIPMYPELDSYIHKYNPIEGEFQGKKVWLLKVDTCHTCPFKSSCTKICPSMAAFHERTRSREDYFIENSSNMESITDEWLEQLDAMEDEEVWSNQLQVTRDDIAWECLSEPQKAAVFMVLVQGKSFEQAAQARGVAPSAVHKSYNSGMDRLKEFGLARKALKTDRTCIFSIEYYENMNDIATIASNLGVSSGLIHKRLSSFRKKYGLTT